MSITRRAVLGLLAAGPLAGASAALRQAWASPSEPLRIPVNIFSVAGFQYYDGPKIVRKIRQGDSLTLSAEPENPYDRFAVEIFLDRVKLGYVPRSDNRHISRILQQAPELLSCQVTAVSPGAQSWKMVQAEVSLRVG